jgi:hypothetical protein
MSCERRNTLRYSALRAAFVTSSSLFNSPVLGAEFRHLGFHSNTSSVPRRSASRGSAAFIFVRPRGAAERREAPALNKSRSSARRHACEAWAVPRNRDAASRRSTVALSAQGPLPPPALLPDPVRRLHATGRTCPAAAPGVSYPRLRAAVDATPAPPSGSSPETPLVEQDSCTLRWMRYVVKNYLRIEMINLTDCRSCPGRGAAWSP